MNRVANTVMLPVEEYERMRRDIDRYRWLTGRCYVGAVVEDYKGTVEFWTCSFALDCPNGESLEDCIDTKIQSAIAHGSTSKTHSQKEKL